MSTPLRPDSILFDSEHRPLPWGSLERIKWSERLSRTVTLMKARNDAIYWREVRSAAGNALWEITLRERGQ